MVEITSNTKTLELTGDEVHVRFTAGFPYFWVRNDSSGTVLMSVSPNIEEGKDGVIEVPAGSSAGTMHGFNSTSNDLYLLGSGKVQVMATHSPENPFRKAQKGGDGNAINSYISNGLIYQSGGNYKNECSFKGFIDIGKPATIEISGFYTNIPSNSGKARWFEILRSMSLVFCMSQYDNILEVYYGNWFPEGQTGITIVPNEFVTISAICTDTSLLLFKNGVFVVTLDTTNYPQSFEISRISFMYGAAVSDRELDGKLNSLRIYNRALTNDEILHNAKADKFMYF